MKDTGLDPTMAALIRKIEKNKEVNEYNRTTVQARKLGVKDYSDLMNYNSTHDVRLLGCIDSQGKDNSYINNQLQLNNENFN